MLAFSKVFAMPPRLARALVLTGSLALLTVAAAVSAQQAAPTQPQQPTFRARVDSVSVDVIVLDKQGNPVADLKPEDFEVRENRKVQTIDTFKYIDIATTRSERPTPARDITSISDQQREAARDDTRVFVIFLDDYHVRLGNSMRIR